MKRSSKVNKKFKGKPSKLPQYKWGGNNGIGDNILAGGIGAAKGLSSLLPGPLSGMAQGGLDKVHGSIDSNISRENQSVMGYGQAAGAIGAGIINPASIPGAISTGAQGLSQGISNGNPTSDLAQGVGAGLGVAGTVGSALYNPTQAGSQIIQPTMQPFKPIMKQGGVVNPTQGGAFVNYGNGINKIVGNSHEDGGVLGQDGQYEAEGGEFELSQPNGNKYIVTNNEGVSKKLDKRLGSFIGGDKTKFENNMKAKAISANEKLLAMRDEKLNKALGRTYKRYGGHISPEYHMTPDSPQMKQGGMIPKYYGGGPYAPGQEPFAGPFSQKQPFDPNNVTMTDQSQNTPYDYDPNQASVIGGAYQNPASPLVSQPGNTPFMLGQGAPSFYPTQNGQEPVQDQGFMMNNSGVSAPTKPGFNYGKAAATLGQFAPTVKNLFDAVGPYDKMNAADYQTKGRVNYTDQKFDSSAILRQRNSAMASNANTSNGQGGNYRSNAAVINANTQKATGQGQVDINKINAQGRLAADTANIGIEQNNLASKRATDIFNLQSKAKKSEAAGKAAEGIAGLSMTYLQDKNMQSNDAELLKGLKDTYTTKEYQDLLADIKKRRGAK